MCNIGLGAAAAASSPASGKSTTSAISGDGLVREQLAIFLADTLRGTAEEQAPLVLTMTQPGAGAAKSVTCHQVAEVSRWTIKCQFLFQCISCLIIMLICWSQQMIYMSRSLSFQFLEDLISSVVQILVQRGRLQGWKPEKMGDITSGVKLLAEQMCSELKTTGNVI